MTTTGVERLARPALLDAAVARMCGDEPTINDVASVLHQLSSADTVDGARIQALCYVAARALGKFDAWTRHCPPDALKDVVADVLQVCQGPSCDNDVAPWDPDCDFCSSQCRNEFARAVGEA